MGGRGGASGFPTNNPVLTTLDAPDGTSIDLSDFPLQYGPLDTLSNAERAAVDAFESKRYKAKVEYGTLITVNGQTLIEKRGGTGSVRMPSRLYNQASVMSHNHPRSGNEVGELGGTFSHADLRALATTGIYTMRATALEGTYSMTKGGNFDWNGLSQYYKTTDAGLDRAYQAAIKPALASYKSAVADYAQGRATRATAQAAYDAYVKTAHYEFNRYMVGLHNALLAGQQQYGYSYTLERRS